MTTQNPELKQLILTKCAAAGYTEKQANFLMKALQALGRRGSAALGAGASAVGRGAKKIAPVGLFGAGTGLIGAGMGHKSGFGKGHAAGSAEGGNVATRNLFKGLLDLQQQGSTSKRSLGDIMPKQSADRIKLARHLVNMQTLQDEMSMYNVPALTKAAADGRRHEERIKYAALCLQYEVEKQAFAGLIGKGLLAAGKGIAKHAPGMLRGAKNLVGKGVQAAGGAAKAVGGAAAPAVAAAKPGLAAGAKAMGAGAGAAAKGLKGYGGQAAAAAKQHLPGAAKGVGQMAGGAAQAGLGAAKGVGQAGLSAAGNLGASAARGIQANPLLGAGATGIAGLAAGSKLPGMQDQASQMYGDASSAVSGAVNPLLEGVGGAADATQGFAQNVGEAGNDIYQGFQNAGQRF